MELLDILDGIHNLSPDHATSAAYINAAGHYKKSTRDPYAVSALRKATRCSCMFSE